MGLFCFVHTIHSIQSYRQGSNDVESFCSFSEGAKAYRRLHQYLTCGLSLDFFLFLFCPGRWPCIELSQLFVFVSQLHACMFLFNFRDSAVSAASSLDSDRAVLFCFVLYLLFVPARRPPCSRASCICIGALSTVLVPCRGVSCPFRCCMGGR